MFLSLFLLLQSLYLITISSLICDVPSHFLFLSVVIFHFTLHLHCSVIFLLTLFSLSLNLTILLPFPVPTPRNPFPFLLCSSLPLRVSVLFPLGYVLPSILLSFVSVPYNLLIVLLCSFSFPFSSVFALYDPFPVRFYYFLHPVLSNSHQFFYVPVPYFLFLCLCTS